MFFKKKKKPAAPSQKAPELPPGIALRVDGVSKRFKSFEALNNISFEVPKGECLGIVGFNGAGKSTLLQIIAKTLQPSEGQVFTKGRVVAMLDLGAGFNPEYTGLENLYMSAAIYGVPQHVIDEKLEEIEAFAEIGNFIKKPVKTYSSGMKVRLAFSMFTQIDPDIMIIDEALAVGDAYFSHKCTHLIKKYREAGKTFLFVSHSPTMVTSLCDRAILLDRGSMIRDGSPANILDYYAAMATQREREAEIRQIEKESGRTVTRSGNGKAQIIRFELTDQNDQPRRHFTSGDKIGISCVIEASEAVEEPTVGFMIRDRFGNDIFGTNTLNLKQSTGFLEANRQIEVNFQSQLFLGPGEYSITLAAHKGADHLEDSYDWFDKLIAFQVMPKPGPFFTGVAALPASATVSQEIRPLNRAYELGTLIDFSDSGNSHRYRASGWHKAETLHTWTDGHVALLEFTSDKFPSSGTLEVTVTPFLCESIEMQPVEIRLNGSPQGSFEIRKKQNLSLPLKKLPSKGTLVIEFHMPKASSQTEFGISSDDRVIALAFHKASITPA